MLSIYNSPILCSIAILSTLSAFTSQIINPILACFSRRSEEEEELLIEIRKQKMELAKIPMKDQFAAHSKVQRNINKLEDQHKSLAQARTGKHFMYKMAIIKGLNVFFSILTVGISIWYRSEPLIVFHQDLFPFNKFLSYPCVEENSISPHAWLIIFKISVNTLKKLIIK